MLNVCSRVAVLFFVAVAVILAAPAAQATDYYADLSGGPWTSSSTWHLISNSGPTAPTGTFPGSAPGDRAIIDFQSITITLSSTVPNPVILDANNVSCFVIVNAGGTLPLTGASQVAGGTILNLSGGTVSNAGTLTIGSTSAINWSSGTITGAGTTIISAGADLNATGNPMIVTGGQTINVFDTLTYGPAAGGLAVNSGAKIVVESGGLFDVQNFNGITTDGLAGASITVNSGGTFLKSNGNFGTNIDPFFNNAGTVQVNVASLGFSRGSYSGSFVMNGPTTAIGFAFPGTHTFNGAAVSVSGTGSAFFGGTTVISAGADLDVTNFSNDSFSSFSGNGTVNLSGTFTWQGSAISGITFNALPLSAVNITGAGNTSLQSAAHFNNQGTMTVSPGATFSIVSDARLTNDGTLNIAGDLTINSDGAPLSRIDNLASRSMSKTAGAGAAHIGVKVNNAGTVSSLQGLLKLQQGGTHTGSWGLGTGAAIVFDGGTHQLTAGSFSGSTATVGLTSGVLDVDANIALPAGIAFQQSGGILTGSGNFTVAGSFLWTGGTMNSSSGGGQTILTGTSSQLSGTTATVVLSGRTLSQTGTFTYNPTAGIELSIDDGGHFLNTGTFNLVGDAEIDSNQNATPRFTNGAGGTINKSTGTGVADLYPVFRNLSTVNLTSGSIALHGGGDDLGTVNFGGAANELVIANGTFILGDQPTLSGGGVVSVDGPFATLGLAAAVTIPKLEILNGSTVSGSTLTIGTSLLWRHGRMLGGVTNVNVGAAVDATSLTGPIGLDTHSLTNNGTFTWDGTTHSFGILNGSSLINNGTFTATGNGAITGNAPANAITNNGTFEKTGGTSGTRIDPVFGNSGQLSSEVPGQSLIVAGGGSQTGGGSLSTVAGAFLDFFSGTYSVAPGTSPFTGSGIFRVNGGTLSIAGSTNVPGPAVLRVDSGTLTVAASSTFQLFGGLEWNGGALAGDGTTRTFNGFIGNTAPTTLNDNHTLTVAGGTFLYNGTSPNLLTIGGTANFNIENSATVVMAASSAIAGTATDGVTISSGGILDTTAGLGTIGHGTLSGGTIATGLAGRLNIGSGTFTMASGLVSGTGTIGVTGGTLTVNASLTFPNLVLSAGTLNGSGALTVNGGSWSGGTMSGAGTTTLAGPFAINAGSVKTLGRGLTNNSTVTENDGFTFTGSAVVTNGAAATWNSLANTPMLCSGCSGKFHNIGAYTKGGNFVTHAVRFDNAGTFTINAGAQGLNLGAGGTHTGDFATATGNLHLGGVHNFSTTSDMTGNGNVQFLGDAIHQGTVVLGDASVNSLGVGPGSAVAFNTIAPVQTPRVNISGTMGGVSDINVNGPGASSLLTGGVLAGGGVGVSFFNIASGATFSVTAGSAKMLDGRTINNAGTFLINGPLVLGIIGGGELLNTTGTLRGQATVSFDAPVRNQATAEFLSGTVAFPNGYSQSGGSTKLAGGTFSSPVTINFTGGSLTGNGTITGNVSHAGTIAPGLSPGAIAITGNLTLAPASVVNIEIAGTAPGTQHDLLDVGGNASLAGTLNATFIGGFTPADGDAFDVVTWNTRSGAFSAVNLPPFPSGTLTGTYEPDAFRITADTVGDLAVTKTGPATAPFGANVTFTITVTNNGPSVANGVVVTDPTPANLTFVSTGGDCTTAFPCALGTIAPSTSRTITATYTVTGGAGTTITNTASVSSTTSDSVAGNDAGSHSVFIEPSDLAISKTGPPRAQPGGEVTFTVVVANGGASPAANVVVSDPTPAGLTFLSNGRRVHDALPLLARHHRRRRNEDHPVAVLDQRHARRLERHQHRHRHHHDVRQHREQHRQRHGRHRLPQRRAAHPLPHRYRRRERRALLARPRRLVRRLLRPRRQRMRDALRRDH